MSAEVLLRVATALEVRPWALHALADSLEGSPYAGQVETISTALAWASHEPGKWRMLAEFLTIARTRPTILETVRLLITADVGETIE